ncbi:MAG: hypothetical protein SVV03_01455 [Candidatus Nanohaloarchaea archaeon]|nr:hypothetical protein [Candidatus Nanohaloarchaea archaeon]
MKNQDYGFEEINLSDMGIEDAYRLEWQEDKPEELIRYLKENNFKHLKQENPTNLRYVHNGDLKAEARIEENKVSFQVYKEIYDGEDKDLETLPLALRGLMEKKSELDLDSWLKDEEELPNLTLDKIKDLTNDYSKGLPTGGHPRDYRL